MKKLIILSIGLAVLVSTLIVNDKQKMAEQNKRTVNNYPLGMENSEARYEWELKRLADPATGKIPEGIRKKELAYAKTLPKNNTGERGKYEWTAMGPYNMGGRTRAAALDVLDENTIIAGSISGGVWKSTNGGSTWRKASLASQNIGASCIAQDTRTGKENTWYIGTGERYNSAKGGSALFLGTGIWKSTDNGETWDTLPSTTVNTPQSYESWDKIWSIVVSPIDTANIVYASTPSTIYKSWDGGNTWTNVLSSSGAGAYSYSNIMITPNGVLYATFSSDGGGKGIWRSADGDNWINIKPSSWGNSYNRIVSAFDPSNENVVYFLANTPNTGKETFNFQGDAEWNSFWKYTYVSGDGSAVGGTWENRSINLPIGSYPFDDFASQGGYDLVIAVKPNNPNTVIIGGTNLYRSTDAFATSVNTTLIGGYEETTLLPDFKVYPTHHPDQHVAFFSPSNPNVMYSGNDGGVYRTDNINADTIVWTSLNNGYLTTQFYSNAIDHGTVGSNVIVGGLQDNGTFYTNSSNPTSNWFMSLSYDGAYCAVEDGANTFYMSIQSGRILKMELDNNGVATATRRIDPIGGNNYDFINPFMLEPVNNEVLYVAGGNKLWRNDSIKHIALTGAWDSISQGWMSFSTTANGNISAFGATYSGSQRLYIGTASGGIYRIDSANVGDNVWINIKNNLASSGYVSSISVDPRDDDKLLVVLSNYNVHSVHYSEDGGQNWWRVSGNMEGDTYPNGLPNLYYYGPYPSCRWGKIIPVADNKTVYLLGTSVGLFATSELVLGTDISTDNTIWVRQGENSIGNAVVNMIDYRGSDGFTAIATHGDGMFTGYITNAWGVTSLSEDKVVKTKLNVYPNPAVDYVTIHTAINSNVFIYSITGKLVKEVMKTKTNILNVDISYFSPGQYIIVSGKETTMLVKSF